jgi:hypothetical protein
MQDRPTVLELLDAVRGFLESQVVPALEGSRRFHARVAANVLSIVARELRDGDAQLRDEWSRLTALLGSGAPAGDAPVDPSTLRAAVATLTQALVDRIRAGTADAEPWRTAVLAHLRTTAAEKLRITNPAYLEETR